MAFTVFCNSTYLKDFWRCSTFPTNRIRQMTCCYKDLSIKYWLFCLLLVMWRSWKTWETKSHSTCIPMKILIWRTENYIPRVSMKADVLQTHNHISSLSGTACLHIHRLTKALWEILFQKHPAKTVLVA